MLCLACGLAAIGAVSGALGGGYSHGSGSGSCSFSPSSALVGQPFTVHAVGLPTGVEVDLIVTNYEVTTHGHGPLAINSDGSWEAASHNEEDWVKGFRYFLREFTAMSVREHLRSQIAADGLALALTKKEVELLRFICAGPFDWARFLEGRGRDGAAMAQSNV